MIPGRLGSINDADDQFRRDGTDDCTEDDGEGIALDEQRSNPTRDAKPSIGSHRNPPSVAASLIPVRIGLNDNGDDRSGAGYCAEREGEGTASGEVSLDLVAATKDTEGRYSALEPVGKGHLRLTPYRISSSGSIEQLLDLPSGSSRPSLVMGQDWGGGTFCRRVLR